MRDHRIALGEGLRGGGVLTGLLRDRRFLDADQRLARDAIQDIDPSGLADFRDGLAKLTVVLQIKQDHGTRRVVIPQVMMHLLKVPTVFSGLCLDGDDRYGEQVVALAQAAVEIRPCIAGGKINEPALRIDGGRLPHHGAAVCPRRIILRPALVTRFSRSWYGVEGPQRFPILGAECPNSAARRQFAAGKSADYHAVEVQRRTRNGESVLPALRLDRPNLLAGALVQRDDGAVKPPQKDFSLANRDAATRPAAAHGRDGFFQVRLINPKLFTGLGIDCKHIVRAGGNINHTLCNDGLRLTGERRPHA